jgi:ABC-2 type transport system permease protein
MVFGGIGGTLTPPVLLPPWARTIAPATPSYWAMRGFRSVILDGGGLSSAWVSIVVLIAFAAGLGALGLLVFDVDKPKRL